MNQPLIFVCTDCGSLTRVALIQPFRTRWERFKVWFFCQDSEYLGCPVCGSRDLEFRYTQRARITQAAKASGNLKPVIRHFTVIGE